MIKRVFLIFTFICATSSFVSAEEAIKNCYPIRAKDLIRQDAPHFDQYSTPKELIQKPAKVNLKSHPSARQYRTVLRRGAAEGANFAGHYSVVGWGCGISCVTFAVVNLKNGNVIFPDDFTSDVGNHLSADDFEPDASSGFWGLRYKIDSRLLIVVGMLDEDENREGAFYYILEKDKLKKIYSVTVKKDGCDERDWN
jgi:hypothetical protein